MRLVAPESAVPAIALKYVLPDERLVVSVRQHPARLLAPLAMAAGGLLAATAVITVAQGVPSATLAVWVLAGLLLLRAVLDVLSWSTLFLIVTERRLILSSGFVGRKVTVIPLPSLQNLAIARSTGGRVLGYGAFSFEANGRARTVIDYVPYPELLHQEIYHLLRPHEADGYGGDSPGGSDLDFDDL